MARAITAVLVTLISGLIATTASASPDNASAPQLAPIESRSLEVPSGWLATAITAHEGALWLGAQSASRPSLLQRYSATGEALETVTTNSHGNVGGIAFDRRTLCNVDYSTNRRSDEVSDSKLERITATGKAQPTAQVGGHNRLGLAWHGNGFFQGHSPIVEARSTISTLDAEGREIARTEMPFYTRGMAWHEGELWVTTGNFGLIYVLDKKLTIVRAYRTTVPLAGLAFVDGALWGLQQNQNRIHRFELPQTTLPGALIASSTSFSTAGRAPTWAPWTSR